jgi:hypothetical protein
MLARCRAILLLTSVLWPAPDLLAVEPSWRLHTSFPAQWSPPSAWAWSFAHRSAPRPTPPGPALTATLHVRNWFLHTSVPGALNTNDIDSPDRHGQVGVVRRVHLGPFDRAGLLVVGSLGPNGLGPALRLEALNGVVGIQPGWMWLDGDRHGPTLAVDISFALIGDVFRR